MIDRYMLYIQTNLNMIRNDKNNEYVFIKHKCIFPLDIQKLSIVQLHGFNRGNFSKYFPLYRAFILLNKTVNFVF